MESSPIVERKAVEPLEVLEAERDRLRRRLRGIEAAISAWMAIDPPQPDGAPESRRWLKKSGKPMRPIEVMLTLLRERNGEMPTSELYELMEAGGCFLSKRHPHSAFCLSIKLNVRLGKIAQTDAAGREIKEDEIMAMGPPFPGVTKLG